MTTAPEPQNTYGQGIHEQHDITDNENGAYEPALDSEAPIDNNEADVDEAAIRVVPAAASRPASGAADLPASAASSEDQRWHNILASFVEDPRSSLKAATEIVREDASAFVALLGQWQESLPGSAAGDRSGETEKMRQALLIYRDVSRQLATSIQSLG